MFVGHFGIAQFGKGARRELPLALLAISAYLPDIIRVSLGPLTARSEELSHAIPVVVALAVIVAAFWLLRGGRFAAAGILAIVCLLHWPADLFTGCKPVGFDGPWFGLVSYRRPVNDLVVEGALFLAGWFYARRRGFEMAKKWLAVAFALQLAFLVTMY